MHAPSAAIRTPCDVRLPPRVAYPNCSVVASTVIERDDDRVRDPSATYVETLARMAALADERGFMTGQVREWNRLVNRLQRARVQLVATEPGRAVISDLVDDPRATVRVWAAGHALFWSDGRARAALVELSNNPVDFGLNATNARMTLREFDAGRLKPDW